MNKNFFKNKSLLITGGTGSFGKALVNYLVKNRFPLKKIIIFSRDELKQFEMSQLFSAEKYNNLRYFIGDIRDKDRLKMAFRDVNFIIHAAALKQVPAAEYNPFEYIKTNVIGAQNIIEACLDSEITNVIALSTDKASSPINLYGATKLCSDKLFNSAQNIVGNKSLLFSVVRYGNVFGSRGSIVPKLLEEKKRGQFLITDPNMTRFNITLDESVKFVVNAILNQIGGEILVPKIPSYRLIDLCKAIDSNCKIKIIGLRPGEKIHEELISIYESKNTIELKDKYIILPFFKKDVLKHFKKNKFNFLKNGFFYSSENNNFLKIADLNKMIKCIR
jgi:UDP-N-acetylglucosamine 4,6-dehydratase (inverting)